MVHFEIERNVLFPQCKCSSSCCLGQKEVLLVTISKERSPDGQRPPLLNSIQEKLSYKGNSIINEVKTCNVSMAHIKFGGQLADILTKPLSQDVTTSRSSNSSTTSD